VIDRLLLSLATLAAGFGLAWWLFAAPTPKPEPAAAAVTQADGSLVIERAAQAPKTKPVHATPKGAKVERVVQVKVQPRAADPAAPAASVPKPVTVDLSLVRLPDQTRRVIASSPDGDIVGGLDIPVEPVPYVAPRPWAAGLSYGPLDRSVGVWVDRDIGPLRAGVEVVQRREPGRSSIEARVRIGIRF
jgi:hypothetical protein